ncbi:hypothetical protein CROQUDRAFT_95266 [Cronartium quercuum f. sp. fusiforme G11]|uniref:Uncharacterized protein n=1 Tax=Cronartium quercuum f. sp. fusiforme G11 TaxID=708437 RepID=A0A9P6T9M1_9BASI|nr:hypothetical protein CROQUDRAFT_95266 [Cronartium quercuum f. sp. fusiforme G11]
MNLCPPHFKTERFTPDQMVSINKPLLINNHLIHPHATSFPFIKISLIEDVERPHLSR